MGKHVHVWTGVGLGLLAVWACSKENTIDNSQTNTYSTAVVCQGPTVDNAMCEAAPEAPPGAFCVYGHCRTPCTSDAQCETLTPGTVCLSGEDGSGCRFPQEGQCGNGNPDCKGGLVCFDGECRAPCTNDECFLQGLSCEGGVCVGRATGAYPEPQPEAGPDAQSEAGPDGSLDCDGFQAMTTVSVPEGYQIDATEVTRCQYEAWLSTNPPIMGQLSYCDWNESFAPSCEWPPGTKGDHPVVCVDWCDAYAYCQAVGKRLCGKIGGGTNNFEDFANASESQWYAACSSGGASIYPYEYAYSETTCNGSEAGHSTTVPVASMSGCQSSVNGYTGVYDLSGNVREWEDSCNANSGQFDYCNLRGGSFLSDDFFLRCDSNSVVDRFGQVDDVGFRCCSSP